MSLATPKVSWGSILGEGIIIRGLREVVGPPETHILTLRIYMRCHFDTSSSDKIFLVYTTFESSGEHVRLGQGGIVFDLLSPTPCSRFPGRSLEEHLDQWESSYGGPRNAYVFVDAGQDTRVPMKSTKLNVFIPLLVVTEVLRQTPPGKMSLYEGMHQNLIQRLDRVLSSSLNELNKGIDVL